MSSTADYVLCMLMCCLVTVSTQNPLELNLTDSNGTAIIKFDRYELIRFYNCLCGIRTERCIAYANGYDNVYDQSKMNGLEENVLQYSCSKYRKDDMLCTRFNEQSTSCRSGERNWTFNIRPRERQCPFAGSISITMNKWSSVKSYDPHILSFTNCTNPNSDDNETKLIIIAAVVAASVFLIVVLAIVVFIFFKKRRKCSRNQQTNVKYRTADFATPSLSPGNTALPSSHTESSAQKTSSNSNTTAMLSSIKVKEKSGTDTGSCHMEANKSTNNSHAIPLLDQVEYCNISGEIKESTTSSASHLNSVTVQDVASDRKRNDTSSYEEVLGEDLGTPSYNVKSTRAYQADAKITMTKSSNNNSDELKKANSTNELEQHVYTAVNKLKQNPSKDYSTLNETVREMTNPYNLLLDPTEYENTTSNISGVTNRKQKTCFELEKDDSYSDRENTSPALPDPYVDGQAENVYEDDP